MPIIDDAYIAHLKTKLEDLSQENDGDSEQGLSEKDAMKRIERLAGVRERSTKELKDRLEKEGFDPCIVEDALSRAVACGLLDDIRFAEALIRGRISAGKGKRGIEYELTRLGIDPENVPLWHQAFEIEGEEKEINRALMILTKKPPTAKNKREAAYRRLVGKGYSSSIASAAARIWSENLE